MNNFWVYSLRAENYRETFGIGSRIPRISWKIQTNERNWRQSRYEIKIIDPASGSEQTSGPVESSESIYAGWPFPPLISRQALTVSVRVWGSSSDDASTWSEPLHIEAGLLDESDWSAYFISPSREEVPGVTAASPYLRKEFKVAPGLVKARMYSSALGLYECRLNGVKAGDQLFTPGWTSYDTILNYQTFDITALLNEGVNTVGAVLAEGWYKGRIGFEGGKRDIWGNRLGFITQIELFYSDGSRETVVSDGSWKWSSGSILSSSIYDGERVDARQEPEGWSSPRFDDSIWRYVELLDTPVSILQPMLSPPVREIETLKIKEVITSPSGKTILDFGQNLVGSLRIRVSGKAGQELIIRHAEVLENGELGVRPLRMAEATDRYILKGEAEEIFEPVFTFHGFRYAEVSGWPGEIKPEFFEARVIHSDMERTGWLETSDKLLNRLHENIRWGLKGNFLSVPTDCPQRDERLGWTGDLQVFSPTASFLYDVSSFLQSWLRDLSSEQKKIGGAVPPVVPNALGEAFGAAAWGDAAAVVPRVLYDRFGDAGIPEAQFESMKNWVDFIAASAGDDFLWNRGFQFGDWLDPTAPPDQPWNARTSTELVATAYFARSAKITADTAAMLGRTADEQKYRELADSAADAFYNEYVTSSGRMMNDAETAYSVALVFDLFRDEKQRQKAGDRLAELVMEGGYHIRTGFVGTPIICDALCSSGHYREAYRLLKQTDSPSWLYPVTMGATTVWERWDSMLPDGSINPGEMTSFNHYALGAVADWMHRTIAGIESAEPGYRHVRIAPRPGGGIAHCSATHISPYGKINVSWKIEGGKFYLDAEIPANCTAEIMLPGTQAPINTGSGSWSWYCNYTDPDLRGPYTVDDINGEILADPRALGILMKTLDELDAPGFLKAVIFTEKLVTLRSALQMLPNPDTAIETVNAAFAGE